MRLDSLRILHLPKGPQTDLRAGARIQALLPEGVFCLDSCQRWLWICAEQDFDMSHLPVSADLSVYSGTEAYRFLLRVATGLESQIVGETDIFGQLKEAWRKSGKGWDLSAWMQKVFEDTKEIRSRFLQNLGGASYGSLVRMLLRDCTGSTLLVGAGQLAQSVAPYLMERELWLINRNRDHLVSLHADLVSRMNHQGLSTEKLRVIESGSETRAWAEAFNVVVCIPFDELKDSDRVALRLASKNGGVVVHLGGMREQSGPWQQLTAFHPLDDLFALQKTQGDVRGGQIQQAARACEEKAKLRALGSSVTLPHGWEDLAVFA